MVEDSPHVIVGLRLLKELNNLTDVAMHLVERDDRLVVSTLDYPLDFLLRRLQDGDEVTTAAPNPVCQVGYDHIHEHQFTQSGGDWCNWPRTSGARVEVQNGYRPASITPERSWPRKHLSDFFILGTLDRGSWFFEDA